LTRVSCRRPTSQQVPYGPFSPPWLALKVGQMLGWITMLQSRWHDCATAFSGLPLISHTPSGWSVSIFPNPLKKQENQSSGVPIGYLVTVCDCYHHNPSTTKNCGSSQILSRLFDNFFAPQGSNVGRNQSEVQGLDGGSKFFLSRFAAIAQS